MSGWNAIKDDSPLHCSALWHMLRLKGKGSTYAFPLYDRSCCVAGTREDSRFFAAMEKLAPYFDISRERLLDAAHLLVESGFWQVIELRRGTSCIYRPVSHDDWKAIHPDCCCEKFLMHGAGEGDPLARELWKITGGMDWTTNLVTGLRRKSGLSDSEILSRAAEGMKALSATKSLERRIELFTFIQGRSDPRVTCKTELSDPRVVCPSDPWVANPSDPRVALVVDCESGQKS